MSGAGAGLAAASRVLENRERVGIPGWKSEIDYKVLARSEELLEAWQSSADCLDEERAAKLREEISKGSKEVAHTCIDLDYECSDALNSMRALAGHLDVLKMNAAGRGGDDATGLEAKPDYMSLLKKFIEDSGAASNEAGRRNPQNHKMYKNMQGLLASSALDDGDMEDEDVVLENPHELNLICPIIMTTLQEPVMNRDCGHTFSKHAIHELLRKSTAGRRSVDGGVLNCPVPGCRKRVTSRSLVPNKKAANALRRMEARKLAQGGDGRGSDDDNEQ